MKPETLDAFFEAWHFLFMHPAFKDSEGIEGFTRALDIEVVKLSPKTNHIEDAASQNTRVAIWLECGKHFDAYADQFGNKFSEGWYHDTDLDCGGATFEEAIIALAILVKRAYGEYREEG